MTEIERPNPGDVIRYKYNYEWEYSRYQGDGSILIMNPAKIEVGTTIKTVVWKMDRPEVRSTSITKTALPCRHKYPGGIGCEECRYIEAAFSDD